MRITRIIILTTFALLCLVLAAVPAFADQSQQTLTISASDNKPIYLDKLLYEALDEIGYEIDVTTTASLQQSYELADSGKTGGVFSSTPDMLEQYPNLIKVPVRLDDMEITAFVRTGSGLRIDSWDDLAGLRIGVLPQREYIEDSLPSGVTVTVEDTTKRLLEELARGEQDVVVLSLRVHETLHLPDNVEISGIIESFSEYLYLNTSNMHLMLPLKKALENVFADGRGGRILEERQVPDVYRKKTILHIISSNTEVSREEQIVSTVKEAFRNDLSIEWYPIELNTKRFPGEARLSYVAGLLRKDCISRDIAAIVVSGREALEFVEDYYFLYFRTVPVIFYGVGEEYESAIHGYENYFTGIVSELSTRETVTAALELFPQTANLYVVNDYTTEGRDYQATIEKQLEPFGNLNIIYNGNTSRDEMLAEIAALPPESLVFVGSYFCDVKGHYFSQNEMKWILENNCKVPVISLYSTDVVYDSIGGKCLDYQKQGQLVAEMLTRVLAGGDASDIPIIRDSAQYNRWVFDKKIMARWGIDEKQLPKGAEVINRAPTLWESDPSFVISIIVFFCLSVVIIIGLLIIVDRFRKKNATLLELRKTLHTAEELLAEEAKSMEVKERLERILTTAPIAFVLTIDGEIIQINDKMKRDTGLNVGDQVLRVYSDPSEREHVLRLVRENNIGENVLIRLRMADGSVHRSIVNVTTVEYGHRQALIMWAIDIEEDELKKDRLRMAQLNLQAILDTMPAPASIADVASRNIVYVNNSFLQLYGIEDSENLIPFEGYTLFNRVQEDGLTAQELSEQLLSTTGLITRDVRIRDSRGDIIDVRIHVSPIEYNGRKSVIGLMTDLTAEREQQRLLRAAAEKEMEANKLKSSFLVNMSHEIRTPMNAIIGLAEIELRKLLPPDIQSVFRKISVSAKSLLQIINDILDLSKIEADKMELLEEEFELEEVINSALLVATPRLDGKNVELLLYLSLDVPRFVIGDKTKLWQILKNFLDNSAKFTDEGRITLSVCPGPESEDDERVCVAFSIEDTGIGMGEEQMSKIFMPYEQFYSEAQKRYSGTGLGTVISKKMCELMGGEMHLESKPGVGTTISLSIPFRRSDNRETEMQAVKRQMLSGARILLVDDDDMSLCIMSTLLGSSGANCMRVSSGEEAISVIHQRDRLGEPFDLILLDYLMGGINGLETARRIQSGLDQSPRLLMVTAYQRQMIKRELDEIGILGVIEKPFIPSQFIERVCAALGYEQESGEEFEQLTQFRGVTILVCEDNLLNQEVAAGMFEQFGIDPIIVGDGKQGVEALAENPVDLIFMDLQMPVMDGYEATAAIRADSRYDGIPIITLTADAMKEIVDKCLQTGMDDHIAKPLEFDSLHEILLKWLPENKRVPSDRAGAHDMPGHDNMALARFGGDTQLHQSALQSFAASLPEVWPDFESMTASREKTLREIHGLKSSAGLLDLSDIHKYALRFEQSLHEGSPDKDAYQSLAKAADAFKRERLGDKDGNAAVASGHSEGL